MLERKAVIPQVTYIKLVGYISQQLFVMGRIGVLVDRAHFLIKAAGSHAPCEVVGLFPELTFRGMLSLVKAGNTFKVGEVWIFYKKGGFREVKAVLVTKFIEHKCADVVCSMKL